MNTLTKRVLLTTAILSVLGVMLLAIGIVTGGLSFLGIFVFVLDPSKVTYNQGKITVRHHGGGGFRLFRLFLGTAVSER